MMRMHIVNLNEVDFDNLDIDIELPCASASADMTRMHKNVGLSLIKSAIVVAIKDSYVRGLLWTTIQEVPSHLVDDITEWLSTQAYTFKSTLNGSTSSLWISWERTLD